MPKTGNAMHLQAARRCGAYARTTGAPCRSPAIRGKVRCRMHGGRAGRKPAHGRYAKDAIAGRREIREVLRLLRDLIDGAGQRSEQDPL
jgi:glucans biosynthesis protein